MVEPRKIPYLSLEDLERRKFDLNPSDEVIVRTSATGTFTPVGMNDFEVTTMDITDTAIKIPTTALTGRKEISIINLSQTATLYVHKKSTVTADNALGTNAGWPVFPQSILNETIEGSIDYYGIAPTGVTIRIKVKENRII